MANKPGGGGPSLEEVPRESDLPQVTPKDLYATSDIRLVMVELGRLMTKVDRLIEDGKEQRDEIGKLRTTVDRFKTTIYVAGSIISALLFVFWLVMGDFIKSAVTASLAPHQAAAQVTSPSPPSSASAKNQ